MFLSEDELEVMRIDCGIASIPPFRIDVPPSSESIWFGAKMTRVESLGQYLGSRKILKVFIICNNINGIGWTFQIVLPNLESFKDSKQFLVMCIVI